jgi:hypothetical protein
MIPGVTCKIPAWKASLLITAFSIMAAIVFQSSASGLILVALSVSLGCVALCISAGIGAGPALQSSGSNDTAEFDQISALLHDLRTQISILQLQLNTIPDARARVAETDAQSLTALFEQLAARLSREVAPGS